MGSGHSDKTPRGLLSWEDILPWQRDNEFILSGYRRASFSYANSVWSILAIHNETANIWSHLLGALFFASMLYQHFQPGITSHDQLRSQDDALALSIYNLSVMVCFSLSTTFHTLSDHSKGMHKFGNELDHLGIVLVMWGTGVSGVHFTFSCQTYLRNLYFTFLTATALGCGISTLQPRFRQPAFRTLRFLMYCFLSASLFAPIAHGVIVFGLGALERRMGLRSFLALALINFTGAAVYAARVPERWFPRTFNLLGQSHNWMHVLVLTGAWVRWAGLVQVVRGRAADPGPCGGLE
ncbi:adiponectin receptor protein 1 [Xylariomycetidae sp. FL2044]|nr:adiponectin receptor protein 1 [Xylariomycetidae sp. FL2044]